MVELQIYNGNDSLSRLWDNLISTGVVNRRLDSTRFGLIFSAIATEISIALSIAQSYQQQQSLQTATDRNIIENLASMFVTRRTASKAKTVLEFYRMDGFNDTVKIPANFAVQSSTDPKIIFYTVTDTYLWSGVTSVRTLAYSATSGSENNVPSYTLTNFAANGFNSTIGVMNTQPAFGGYDDESIESVRRRATGFRYERDNSLDHIKRKLWDLGYSSNVWTVTDDNNEPGSYTICLDTDIQDEFEDVKTQLQYRATGGITQIFVQAQRIYVDFYVTVYTTGNVDYTPVEKENIFATVQQSIQNFFTNYCTLGVNLNLYHLTAAVTNALSNYNITQVDIATGDELEFQSQADYDKENAGKDESDIDYNPNLVVVNPTIRICPNRITTTLKYQGDL